VEKELLSEVKPATATGGSVPTSSSPKAAESRDISPGTIPGSHTETQTAPIVTTGVDSATTPETSSSLKAAAVAGKQPESRDISPGTLPGSQTQTQTAPTVTTGVGSAPTEKKSTPATPAPSSSKAPESPASSTATDKKKKRTSIFGKLKAKLHSKD